MVMRQIAPTVAAMCGEAAKLVILRKLQGSAANVSAVSPQRAGETPPDPHGCPYCAISRHLSVAHRYLARGQSAGTFASTYQELARVEVSDAVMVSLSLPVDFDTRTLELARDLQGLEASLGQPLLPHDFKQVADHAWTITDLAMDLAERFQSDTQEADGEIDDVERQVTDLDDEAIEAVGRVVG